MKFVGPSDDRSERQKQQQQLQAVSNSKQFRSMASRLEHVIVLSMSLVLILILLVTVTVLAAPSGLLDFSASSSSSSSSAPAALRKNYAGAVAQEFLQNEGAIPRRFDRAPGQKKDQDLRGVDAMAAAGVGANGRLKVWPELVGLEAEEAKQKILADHPTLQVQIVPEGNMVTMDFNLRRVRIFKNEHQKVAKTPRLG